MTEVRFYHLQNQSEAQVLPLLLSKAIERGHRIIVKCLSVEQMERVNEHLWTYSPSGFLPHGSAKNGNAANQPIWLTTEDENPNESDVLILCQGVTAEFQGEFKLCCEMLNGHDPEAVTAARGRWKAYKEKEFDVTYWQQTDQGGWQQKA